MDIVLLCVAVVGAVAAIVWFLTRKPAAPAPAPVPTPVPEPTPVVVAPVEVAPVAVVEPVPPAAQ